MLELDTKQKVLIATYIEYQKDIPDFEKVLTANTLNISDQEIGIALRKLQYEQLITEYETRTSDGRVGTSIRRIMMTRQGIEYVENKLTIEPKSAGSEKLKTVVERAAIWSWEQAKEIASKTLSDIINSQILK